MMKLRAFLFAFFFSIGANAQTVVNTNNVNNNTNNSTSVETINSTSTSTSTNKSVTDSRSSVDQTLRSPPPTAIAPAMMSGGGNDLCTTGVSGAVQTQILGISAGSTIRDLNCERLKLSKTLYDMGMKVAAVSTMCQDIRVFNAMMDAGTPCPIDGKIGNQAKAAWEIEKENREFANDKQKNKGWFSEDTKTYGGFGGIMLLLLLLL
jgi:hypothetical protein